MRTVIKKKKHQNPIKKYLIIIILIFLLNTSFIPITNANSNNSNLSDSNIVLSQKETIYLGYFIINFTKELLKNNKHSFGYFHGGLENVSSNLDELIVEICVNYSVEMNYSSSIFFTLAPIQVFGIKVENYSCYEWESFKMKYHGYEKKEGNITIEITIDMENIESGDILILQTYIYQMSVPFLKPPTESHRYLWQYFFRFAYNLPIANKQILHNWLFQFFAPYNEIPEPYPIYIYFY
jgi:hypothetical protein